MKYSRVNLLLLEDVFILKNKWKEGLLNLDNINFVKIKFKDLWNLISKDEIIDNQRLIIKSTPIHAIIYDENDCFDGIIDNLIMKLTEDFPSLLLISKSLLFDSEKIDFLLIKLFTLADFDKVIEYNSIKTLVEFQSKNKYLLMALHQKNQKSLGKIVANDQGLPIKNLIMNYYEILLESLHADFRLETNINTLMHIFGYFKNDLSKDQKSTFVKIVDNYRSNIVPFNKPLMILSNWSCSYNYPYLQKQTLFNPYPKVLVYLLTKP